MTRLTKTLLGLALAAAALAIGARAHAQRHHGGFFAHHIQQQIDAALDAAKATPEQRAAIDAAREHVMAAIESTHTARKADLEDALALFSADTIDPQALAKHRARREAEGKTVGDAVVQALYDTHDALTASQRQIVADRVRAQLAEHAKAGGPPPFVKKMIEHRVEVALDEIKATPEQRQKLSAVKDRLMQSFVEGRPEHRAEVEQALALFVQDKIDAGQVQALRNAHQARAKQMGDQLVQALTDVHDILTRDQRAQLVAWVRAHHKEHHG